MKGKDFATEIFYSHENNDALKKRFNAKQQGRKGFSLHPCCFALNLPFYRVEPGF
jgi:hypothetical protein